jgi:hypothetical protein
MAFATSFGCLIDILAKRVPAKSGVLAREQRRVNHGLLSVGLKLHCLGGAEHFAPLIEALGGAGRVLERNYYKRSDARLCLVLPPTGSARVAVLLLDCLADYTGAQIFNNPNVQLQVCSPGRLTPRSAALHAIGFYMASDTLRTYALDDFATTVSRNAYHRGKRLVIYDGGMYGEFDTDFQWWARTDNGLLVRDHLPFLTSRTDILVGPGSPNDIHNINLLATLLMHAQAGEEGGYWQSLGELFVRDFSALLNRHLLLGALEAPWVCRTDIDGDGDPHSDEAFLAALQEIMVYARSEVSRLSRAGADNGILCEVQALLRTYRDIISSITLAEQGERT